MKKETAKNWTYYPEYYHTTPRSNKNEQVEYVDRARVLVDTETHCGFKDLKKHIDR